jgi:hypothetical protein
MSQQLLHKIRNLRVVRIDDRATAPVPREKYFAVAGDGVVRHPLELVTYKVKEKIGLAINGLEAARMFWLQFVPALSPDIVLGDINFEHDESSPLQSWDREAKKHLPNGLMHCKPFVAIARASGRPLSVVLHTADPNQWQAMASPSGGQDDRKRVFMLLAAQEVMEVAAIFGQVIPGADRGNLGPVWQWLHDRTQTTPKAALETALVDYRKQVVMALRSRDESSPVRLRVGFSEWKQLLAWCQRMKNAPKALSGEADPGLPLLYPDGRTDRVSIASLFADLRNVCTETLHASCFEAIKVREPWSLSRGLPQIGALIEECGELGEVVAKAETALRELPLSNEHLLVNLRRVLEDPLAMGFAVLFRILEIYRSDETRWEQIWNEGHWHPGKRVELDDIKDYNWAMPLSQWVELAAKALRDVTASASEGEEFIDLDTISEKFKTLAPSNIRRDLTTESIGWHLDILCELGVADSQIGLEGLLVYRIRTGRGDVRDLTPSLRPVGAGAEFNWQSDSLPLALRDSLGFGTRGPGLNDNAIGQILHDAFLGDDSNLNANERAKSGRDFLEAFRNGNAPGWIQETCRTYCQEVLRWHDTRRWPKCIAPRS